MKTILLIITLFATALASYSQDRVHFNYDNYGNRTERNYVISVQKTRSFIGDEDNSGEETGIGETKKEIRIYPNPTKGHLQIETAGYTGKMGLRLYSNAGQLMQQLETGNPAASLDLSDAPQGTYILWVTFGKEREEYKIMKE